MEKVIAYLVLNHHGINEVQGQVAFILFIRKLSDWSKHLKGLFILAISHQSKWAVECLIIIRYYLAELCCHLLQHLEEIQEICSLFYLLHNYVYKLTEYWRSEALVSLIIQLYFISDKYKCYHIIFLFVSASLMYLHWNTSLGDVWLSLTTKWSKTHKKQDVSNSCTETQN